MARVEGAVEGALGRGGRPPLKIERAASKISIDGVLDEPAWKSAAKMELQFETRPAENTAPPVRTEMLVTYDEGYFYAAFRAQDPKPSEIRAHLSDRDTAFSDDFVGIVLDPFNDERRAFEFFINPLGVQMDLFQDDVGGNEDDSWDAIWDGAGKIHEGGYDVEIAIPWSSLRFPRTEGEQTWGFDALRFYPRDVNHRISSHPLDRNVTCYLCQASKMTGFSGITPGRNMELDPTVTAGRTDQREDDAPDGPLRNGSTDTDVGLTARWGITPNLTLNAALNPDFSQVEADAAQLDVNTQFALFFPEKRPFFLEGADFFRSPFDAVFTRNVADPSWGAKLTGKEGKNGLGVFVARDERTNLILPGSNGSDVTSFDMPTTDAVLRYRRDFGGSSALGGLVTAREGTDGYFNRVAGLDGVYRLNGSNTFRAQFLRSQTEYPVGPSVSADLGLPAGTLEDNALWLSWDLNSRDWYAYARYEDVGRDFRADMGFLPRVDYNFLLGGLRRIWYPQGRWHRASFGGDWDRREDQRGQLLEEEIELFADFQGPRQSDVELDAGQRQRFFNGVTFDETFGSLYAEANLSGDFFASLFVRGGDEIDFANTQAGEVLQIEPSVRFNLGVHLRTRLSHAYQKLDVDGGRLFTANLTQLSTVWQWNVRTFLRAIVQYTDVERTPRLYIAQDPADVDRTTERLFTQLLFSYKLNPQTVFFLGYSDNSLGDQRIDLTRANRTFFLKLGYAWLP
ncbi:MAG TPA: DUF5916 domain-containing protein [Thermoanaerobaculia bacterium]|nr:DUF5916 domain-containing protein [Thermoanaerobaculia bacterium]